MQCRLLVDLGEEPAQLLLTSYELVEMSSLFNVSEAVVFTVLRDILAGDEWIEQPHIVNILKTPLMRLCARYLYVEKKRGYAINPVG
jgi:malonyl-CoA decarboxylase